MFAKLRPSIHFGPMPMLISVVIYELVIYIIPSRIWHKGVFFPGKFFAGSWKFWIVAAGPVVVSRIIR